MDPELERVIKNMTLQECQTRLQVELMKPGVSMTGSNAIVRALNQQMAIRQREVFKAG